LGVANDGLEPRHRSVGSGRVGRHSNDTGIQTAAKGFNEPESRRVEEQSALTGEAEALQSGRQGPCAAVKLAACQRYRPVVVLTIAKECEETFVGFFPGATAQKLDKADPFRACVMGSGHEVTQLCPSGT
jgi:hypothetical protein